MREEVKSLSELVEKISKIEISENTFLVFRGEPQYFEETALVPSVYRNSGYIKNEDKIYREMQRFNDFEFKADKTTFDKLSRIQHYGGKTRLLDVSEDLLSAVYFALENKNKNDKENAIIYVFEIYEDKVKYYDSDSVSVVSNLAKIPLKNKENEKSKEAILSNLKCKNIKKFNKKKSIKFLRHEIREEKPQFEPIIEPKHITSVLFVKPKLTTNRIKYQKGSFFLFGLNPDDAKEPIKLLELLCFEQNKIKHPLKKLYRFEIKSSKIDEFKKDLEKLGITPPFIYPELDKVAEYLDKRFKDQS
jgi:hypothetical protein